MHHIFNRHLLPCIGIPFASLLICRRGFNRREIHRLSLVLYILMLRRQFPAAQQLFKDNHCLSCKPAPVKPEYHFRTSILLCRGKCRLRRNRFPVCIFRRFLRLLVHQCSFQHILPSRQKVLILHHVNQRHIPICP